MVLALHPSLTREDRDPLTSVAVVVVAKPRARISATAPSRPRRRVPRSPSGSNALPALRRGVIEAGQADGETDGHAGCSATLNATLADVRPTVLPAAIFITDAASMTSGGRRQRSALRRPGPRPHYRHA